MLEQLWTKVQSLHWGAGFRAAFFALFGKGDPALVYPAVRTKRGFLAFLILGIIVIGTGVVASVLTGTLGTHSLERAYEVWDGDGVFYLKESLAILIGSLIVLGIVAQMYAYVLQKWIGTDDRAVLFWLSLCLPAALGVIALNLCIAALIEFGFALITLREPYGAWVVGAVSLTLLIGFQGGFATLAVFRFQRVFVGHALSTTQAFQFFLYSAGLFALCSFAIGLTAKSLEFLPGHPTADRIRAGEVPSLASQIMSCRSDQASVECALVLWPKDFQRYTVYERWDLAPLIGALPAELAVTSPASLGAWRLYGADKPLPWVHLSPDKPEDILIRSDRAAACQLKPDSATAYRFDVPARATMLSEKPRRFLTVSIVNPQLLAESLKDLCKGG